MSKYTTEDISDYLNWINEYLDEKNEEELHFSEDEVTPETIDIIGENLHKIFVRLRKEREEAYKRKMQLQRYKRGFADEDVWSMDVWFIHTVRPMLQQMRDTHVGSPASLGENYVNEEGVLVNDKCHEEWDAVLDKMIFLLGEMDEESCTKKNPHEVGDDGWLKEEENIAKYRDDCKNEFFKLFSEFFWDLWD